MNALVETNNKDVMSALKNSIYPGATDESIAMVLAYCRASNLDPIQKPVHIVPMSVKKGKDYIWRDVVMPGIGLYRTQAERSGKHLGTSEPMFGPLITETLSGVEIIYPEWCKVTVTKLVGDHIASYTSQEFWKECYATAGKDTTAPNAMWKKRARGQLAKCAEAQALRKAFPDLGSQPTAEEMEGKIIDATGSVIQDDNNDLMTKWTLIARTAPDAANLTEIWQAGVIEFRAAKDIDGANAFKLAVGERGAELKDIATKALAAMTPLTTKEAVKNIDDDFVRAMEEAEAKANDPGER